MEQLTFEEGMKLSFRINDLKREVADFLETNFDQSGALPVFIAEQELHSVVSKAVHKQFTALVKEDPKFLHKAKEMGMSDKAIKSICEDLKAEGITFEPVE